MDTAWREDPALKGRFHLDYPDDLQVIVHDGDPRFTHIPPELIWVHVVGKQGKAYIGIALNQPHNLKTVKQNGQILFLMPEGRSTKQDFPILVTARYLEDRDKYEITPCNQCGFSELLEPPSDLGAKIWQTSGDPEDLAGFTVFCAICGGTVLVVQK